jgi:hypothetical protein
MFDEDHTCESCRTVVMRTYRELLEKGQDQTAALCSAMHVLAIRHPEQRASLRAEVIAGWLAAS